MKKEPTPETRAVIAAAVYVTLGSGARIAALESVPPAPVTVAIPPLAAWSLEGRRQIHSGHKVR